MKQSPWLSTQEDLMQGISLQQALPTTNFATWLFWKASEDKSVGERAVLLAALDMVKLAMKFAPRKPPEDLKTLYKALDFAYGYLSAEGTLVNKWTIDQLMFDTWGIAIKHYSENNYSTGWALVSLNQVVGIVAGKFMYSELWRVACIASGAAGYAFSKSADKNPEVHHTKAWEAANLAFQKKASDLFRKRVKV